MKCLRVYSKNDDPAVHLTAPTQHPASVPELIYAINQIHREVFSDWQVRPAIELYRELGFSVDESQEVLEEALSIQCITLLLGEAVCNFSAHTFKLYASFFQATVIKLFKKLARSFVSRNRSLQALQEYTRHAHAASLKWVINDFLEQASVLSAETTFTLLSAIELIKLTASQPFLMICQGVLNIPAEAQAVAKTQMNVPFSQLFTRKSEPFLPEYRHKEYTLILDLDETLGHLSGQDFLPRPGVEEFLEEASELFEIVCFTAGSMGHAYKALDIVDPQQKIQLVLHREHTSLSEGCIVKDLTKLGRDLSKTLIVDNLEESFKLQPENGVLVSSWVGDATDTALAQLLNWLKEVPNVPDVRQLATRPST